MIKKSIRIIYLLLYCIIYKKYTLNFFLNFHIYKNRKKNAKTNIQQRTKYKHKGLQFNNQISRKQTFSYLNEYLSLILI